MVRINFCPNCGEPLRGDELFCSKCGSEIFTMKQYEKETTLKETIKPLFATVVKIETNIGSGSGFIADTSGIIVTNYHVIEGASEIWVKLSKGVQLPVDCIIAINTTIDYAILKIQPPDNLPLKKAVLGDSDTLGTGDKVIVIGNPLGKYEKTVSTGIISAFRQEGTRIQMTAPTSPGSSGGPVFNEKGEVIGIHVEKDPDGQNINFFIPINLIKPAIKEFTHNFEWENLFNRKISFGKILSCAFHPKEKKIYILTDESIIEILDFDGKKIEPSIKVDKNAKNIFFINNGVLGIHKPGKIILADLIKSEKKIITSEIDLFPLNSVSISSTSVSPSYNLLIISEKKGIILYCFLHLQEDSENFCLVKINDIGIIYDIGSPIDYVSLTRPLGLLYSKYYSIVICDGVLKIFAGDFDPNEMIIKNFSKIKELEYGAGAKITSAAISPDMTTLIIGLNNGKIKMANFIDTRKKLDFKLTFSPFSFISEISAITFNNEGDYVLCGSDSGDISLLKRKG